MWVEESQAAMEAGDTAEPHHGAIPIAGQLSESEEKHLRLRVKQLICGSLNGMRIRQSLWQP